MGAGIEVGAGRQQGGALQAQIQIDTAGQALQPFQGGAQPLPLGPIERQPLAGQVQGLQVVVQGAAEGVDQQGADVTGAADPWRPLPPPLGPGTAQLL